MSVKAILNFSILQSHKNRYGFKIDEPNFDEMREVHSLNLNQCSVTITTTTIAMEEEVVMLLTAHPRRLHRL